MFEKGMSARDSTLVMQGFRPDAVWQGVMTYPNVEDNIIQLFRLYRTIQLARRDLELFAVDDRVASRSDYRFSATTIQGERVELDATFHFLWEKQGNDWWIIATDRPVLIRLEGSIEDDLNMIDSGSGTGPADAPASGAATGKFDQAVARLCAPDEDFIRSLYHCITHREPTEQEIQAQVARLRDGAPRQHMIAYFFASPGYVNLKHDGVRFMTDACQAIYGRQPAAAELKAWPRTDRKTIINEMFKNPAHLAAIKNCAALWHKKAVQEPPGVTSGDAPKADPWSTSGGGVKVESDPILSASPGKSIVGCTLPLGTYRVVPELGPGQSKASVSVTLVNMDSGEPKISDQPKTGTATAPIKTETPQAGSQKQQTVDPPEPGPTESPQAKMPSQPAQDPKKTEPSGTGPEYDCEYGLPRRDGADCALQLTPGDLPAGFHLDDLANFNKACEVHQWIMHGPDRRDRVELSISAWNARAAQYYEWKHGMLGSGEFEHTDLSVGTKELYVEQRGECNKQLIMQAGNYLVEMHRPLVEGLTQQTDPISRQKFVAVAEACEARIAAVAGIPDKQMLNDNPSDFRWGNSVVWPVSFENGTLKVQCAGRPKWGTQWVVVDTGVQSYRGQGTGAGPVVTYTKDGKSWTVVLLDHATGGKNNQRGFKYRVDIRSVGQYGATLRVAGRCYDYSWNHLKEIDCGSGSFTQGKKTQKPENDDPTTIQDKDDPNDVTPTTGTGGQTGQQTGTSTKPTLVLPLSTAQPEPDSWQASPSDVDMSCPEPPSQIRRFFPGVEEYVVGDRQEIKIYSSKTDEEITGGSLGFLYGTGEKGSIGHFEGNILCADNPGCDWIVWNHYSSKPIAWLVRVVPGEQEPLPVEPWSTSPEELLFGRVYVMKQGAREYVNGVRISLNRVDGRNLDTESKTGKNQAGQNEEGHYGFTGMELGRLPTGTYSIRCYKQTGTVSTDLWHKTEYRVSFPLKPGDKFTQDIELSPAGKKWNTYDLDELDKKLNQ